MKSAKTRTKLTENLIRTKKTKQEQGITLIAVVITIILHYDYLIKVRNSNGFLGAVV